MRSFTFKELAGQLARTGGMIQGRADVNSMEAGPAFAGKSLKGTLGILKCCPRFLYRFLGRDNTFPLEIHMKPRLFYPSRLMP